VLRGEFAGPFRPQPLSHSLPDAPVGHRSQPDQDQADEKVRMVEGGHPAAGRGGVYLDGGGPGDALHGGEHRDRDEAVVPERSGGRGQEPEEAGRQGDRGAVLRGGSEEGALRDVQAEALRQVLHVVFYR
jgi:hypothetical protein